MPAVPPWRRAPGLVRPPGPPHRRAGLLGSAGYYARFFVDPVGFVRERFERHGDIYYASSDAGGLYVLRHPDHLREVLITRAACFSKEHSSFRQLARFLGQGLLTADGETWRRHRRMIQPAFQQARLSGYAAIMADEARRAGERLADGVAIDLGREMTALTLRVVSRSLFGHDAGADLDVVSDAMATFQRAALRPDLLPSWLPLPRALSVDRAVASLDRIILGMIERRRARPDGGSDLLGALLAASDDENEGARMSPSEVRDELVTLFLAGHETTSQALTWAIYALAQNPEAERRTLGEIDAVLGGRPPSADDLPRLTYTGWVVDEAMRLYPPVYSVGRRASVDTEIGGYTIPAGSEVMLWIYLTHHDARWWPDPEAFRPERFAPEVEATRPKLAYLPFGAGPRACIGKTFATIEARLLLATLLSTRRFVLASRQRVEPRPRITLTPGRPIRVIPRRLASAEHVQHAQHAQRSEKA